MIAVSCHSVVQALGLQELWIAFDKGRSFMWIPVHDLAIALGPMESCSSTTSLVVMSYQLSMER